MSSEHFTYKGISAGKYVEGNIEAINQEEASFKLKEQKIIITNLVKTKKKKAAKNSVTKAKVSPSAQKQAKAAKKNSFEANFGEGTAFDLDYGKLEPE